MSASEQRIEVALLMAGADFGDRSRIAAPHLGISWTRAASDGGLDARARTLSDQGAFKLREGSQHLGHQHALCAGSIDRIADRPEVGALGAQRFDNLEQMRQRARQAINPYHQQGVVLPYPVQCSCKVRALPIRSEEHTSELQSLMRISYAV